MPRRILEWVQSQSFHSLFLKIKSYKSLKSNQWMTIFNLFSSKVNIKKTKLKLRNCFLKTTTYPPILLILKILHCILLSLRESRSFNKVKNKMIVLCRKNVRLRCHHCHRIPFYRILKLLKAEKLIKNPLVRTLHIIRTALNQSHSHSHSHSHNHSLKMSTHLLL